MNGTTERFAYHRAVAPMLWVLVAVAAVELLAVHLLVGALVGKTAALVLSALTLAGVVWLVAAIAAMRSLPVELGPDGLVMRVGRLKRIDVPAAAIAGVRQAFDAIEVKDRATLNLALVAYPNVIVDLEPPLRQRRRTIRAVAHRFDDAAAFVRAIERLVAAR